jgi:hypothetical protein
LKEKKLNCTTHISNSQRRRTYWRSCRCPCSSPPPAPTMGAPPRVAETLASTRSGLKT